MLDSCRGFALAALIFVGLVGCGEPEETETTPAVEILWDTWGVPHLFASDAEGLFYAHGWAQARAHGDLVLRLMGEARGRAAEVWGDEAALDSDRWVHTVGIPRRAGEWYEAQSAEARTALDAFARGVNDYAARHPDRLADEVEAVLPIDGRDLLAHLQRVLHFSFVAPPWDVRAVSQRWEAGEEAVGGVEATLGRPTPGSNAWAIAPKRSASGKAMLLANPHLPWSGYFTWFEVHMKSPEVDVSGAALVGTPFIGIGFNDRLGWTHTVNTHDGADLYELTLEGDGYLFDGVEKPFEIERKTIKVRGAGGALRDEELVVLRSVHGPVVAERDGKALALRVVGLDRPALFEQYWEMARAKNLEQFEAAVCRLQAPLFTVMYADREGHVLHLFGGQTPVRDAGGWSDWAGVVPGDSSRNLWKETHRCGELPRVLDPESGWLQNANDPPWTTTLPLALDPDAYPAYMAPRSMSFRAQRSARMILADESISFEEMKQYKHSNRMELADRLLDDLAVAVATYGSARARAAMEVLEVWDRTADAASRGGVLFESFVRGLGDRPFAEPWDAADPLETPDGFADPAAAAAALERAAREVEKRHGALDVAWGDVHRLRLGGRDLAANGGPGDLGIFRVVRYRPAGDGKAVPVHGDTYVAAVAFGEPLRAEALLAYGNASQPGSPHVGDQLELFARKELRPVWRGREEIEAHLEEREVLELPQE